MQILFHLLLLLEVKRCTSERIFETLTVGVGDEVKLTCSRSRQGLENNNFLFWIRLLSGDFPQILASSFTFDDKTVKTTSRFTTKQEPGTFVLQINETKRSDAGVYYCVTVEQLKMKFLKGTFLRVKEPEITAVVQVPPSPPFRPGQDSVTLQCSVQFDSDQPTCPSPHSVYWFRAGSDQSHPSFIHGADECETGPTDHSVHKCVYNFCKNISSSDDETHYCAVATCGQILFGRGIKVDNKAFKWDLQKASTVLWLVCVALALSLIANVFLIKKIHRPHCWKAAPTSGDQPSQQKPEELLVYSAPNFTKRNAGRTRGGRTSEEETVYSGIRTK